MVGCVQAQRPVDRTHGMPLSIHVGDGFRHSPMPPIRIRLQAAEFRYAQALIYMARAGNMRELPTDWQSDWHSAPVGVRLAV
jgi:hypothetical protein